MWNNFNNHPKRGANRSRRPSGGYRPRGNRGRGGQNQWGNHNSHHQLPPPPLQFPPQQLQQPHFGNGNAPQFSAFSSDSFQSPPFLHGGIDFDRPVPSAYRIHSGRGRDRESHFPPQLPPLNRPKRFLSPPRTMPPQRPPSPLPGSEEYRQRNIQHTSELIKRQLLGDDSMVEPPLNVSTDGMGEGGVPSVFQRDVVMQQPPPQLSGQSSERENKRKEKPKTRTSRNDSDASNRPFDVHEIHHQIVRHISNLSHNKKANIVNQVGNTAGYDVAILQIQKQKRLELSRALRDLCSSNIPIDPDSDVLNDIIPDIGIKLEDLPLDVIVELSSLNAEHQWGSNPDDSDYKQDTPEASQRQFLSDFANISPPLEDVHMGGTSSCYIDSSIVDPELCFKQAEQLISGFDEETSEYIPTSPYDTTGVLYDNVIISEFAQTTDELPSVGFSEETPLFCEQVSEIHEGDAIDSFVEQIPELHTCGYSALPNSEIFSDPISDIRDSLPCSNVNCDYSQPAEQLSFTELPCKELVSVSEDTVKLFENDTIPEFEEEVPHIVPPVDEDNKFANSSIINQSADIVADLSAIQLPKEPLSVAPPSEQVPILNEESSAVSTAEVQLNSNLISDSITLNQQLSKSSTSTKNKISIVIEKSPKLPPNIFNEEPSRRPTKNSTVNSEKIFKKLCNETSKSKSSTPENLYCDIPPVNESSEGSSEIIASKEPLPLPIKQKKEPESKTKVDTEKTVDFKEVILSETNDQIIEESKVLNPGKPIPSNTISCTKTNSDNEKCEPIDLPKPQKSESNSGKSSPIIEKKIVNDVPKTCRLVTDKDKSSPPIEQPSVNSDKSVEKSKTTIKPLIRQKSLTNSDEALLIEEIRPRIVKKVEKNDEVVDIAGKSKPATEGIRLKRNRKLETIVEVIHPTQPRKSDKSPLIEEFLGKNNRKIESSLEAVEVIKPRKPETKWEQNLLIVDPGVRTSRRSVKTVDITNPGSSDNILDISSSITTNFTVKSRKNSTKKVDFYEQPTPRKSGLSKGIKEVRELIDVVRSKSEKLKSSKKRMLKAKYKSLDEKQVTRQRLYDYINSLPSFKSKVISRSDESTSRAYSAYEVAHEVNRSPALSFNEKSRNPENPNYNKNSRNVILFNAEEPEEGELPQSPEGISADRQWERRFEGAEVLPDTDTTFEAFSSDVDVTSEFATNSNEGRLSPMSRRMASAPMNPFADMETHNVNRVNAGQSHTASVVKFSDLKTLKNSLPHGVSQDASMVKSSRNATLSLLELNPNRSYLDVGHRSDYKNTDEHIGGSGMNGNNCANCIHCREKLAKEEKRKAKKRDQGMQKIKLRRKKLNESSACTGISIDIPAQMSSLVPPVLEISRKKAWRSPAERKIMPEQAPSVVPRNVKMEKKSVYEMEEEQLDYDETLNETEEEKTDSVTESDLRVIPLIEIKEEIEPVEQTVSSNILEQIEVFNNSMGRIFEKDKTSEEISPVKIPIKDIGVAEEVTSQVRKNVIKVTDISKCADTSIVNILNKDVAVTEQLTSQVTEDVIKVNNMSKYSETITTSNCLIEVPTDTGQNVLSSANDSQMILSSHEISTTATNCPILIQTDESNLNNEKSPRTNKVLILENISLSELSTTNLKKKNQNLNIILPEVTDISVQEKSNLTTEKLNQKSDEIETATVQYAKSSEESKLIETDANTSITKVKETKAAVAASKEQVTVDTGITVTTDSKSKVEDDSKQDGRSKKSTSNSYKHSSSNSSGANKKSSSSSADNSKGLSSGSTKHSSSNSRDKRSDKSSKSNDKVKKEDKDISNRSRSQSSDPSKSSRDHSTSLEPDKKSASKSTHKSSKDSKSDSQKVDGSKDKSNARKDDGKSSQSKGKSYKSSSYSSSSHSKPDTSRRDVTKTSIMIQTDETKHSNTHTQTEIRKTPTASKHVQVGSVKTLNKCIETDPKTLVSVSIQTDDIEIENMFSDKGKSKKNVLAQMRDIDKEIERLLKLKSELYRRAEIYSDGSDEDNDVKERKAEISDDRSRRKSGSRKRGPKRKGDPMKDEVRNKTRRLRSHDHIQNDEDDNNSLKDMLESTLRELVDPPISKENDESLIQHNTRASSHKNKMQSVDDSSSIEYILAGIDPIEGMHARREEHIQIRSSTPIVILQDITVSSMKGKLEISPQEMVTPTSKQRDIIVRHPHEIINTRNRKLKSLAATFQEIDESIISNEILQSPIQKVVVPITNKDSEGATKVAKRIRNRKLTSQDSSNNEMEDISTKETIETNDSKLDEVSKDNDDSNEPDIQTKTAESSNKEATSSNSTDNILENEEEEIVANLSTNETEVPIEVDIIIKHNTLNVQGDLNKPIDDNLSSNTLESLEANPNSPTVDTNEIPLKYIEETQGEVIKAREISLQAVVDNSTAENVSDNENQETPTTAMEETENMNGSMETKKQKPTSDDDVEEVSPTKDIWQTAVQEISLAISERIENNKTDEIVETVIQNQVTESNAPKEILTKDETQVCQTPTVEIEIIDTPNIENDAEINDAQASTECENVVKLTRPKRVYSRKSNELQKPVDRVDNEDVITQSRMARRLAHKNAEAVKMVEQKRQLRTQRKPTEKYKTFQQNMIETVTHDQNSRRSGLNKDLQVGTINKQQESATAEVTFDKDLQNDESVSLRRSDDTENSTTVQNKGSDSLVEENALHQQNVRKNLHEVTVRVSEMHTHRKTVEDAVNVDIANATVLIEPSVQNQCAISSDVSGGSDIQKAQTDSKNIPAANKTRNRNILKSERKRHRQISDSSTSTTDTLKADDTKRPGRRRGRPRADNSATVDNPNSAMGRINTDPLTNNILYLSKPLPQIDNNSTTAAQASVNDAILLTQTDNTDNDAELSLNVDRERRSASISSLCPSDGLENLMEVAYEEPIMHSGDSASVYRGPKRKRQRKGRFRSESIERKLSISLAETIDCVARNITCSADPSAAEPRTKEYTAPNNPNVLIEFKQSVVHVVRYSLSDLLTMKANLLKPTTEDNEATEDTVALETIEPNVTSELTSHLDIKCEPRSVESHHSDHDPVLDDEQPPTIEDSRLTVPYINEDTHATIEMPNLQESTDTGLESKERKVALMGFDVDILEDITADIISGYDSPLGLYTTESSNIRIDLPRDGPDDEPSTIIDRETFGGCVGPIIAVRAIESYVLGSSDRGTLYIYDLATSTLLSVLDIATKALTALCVVRPPGRPSDNKSDSTGQLLYTGALDRTVAVVDYKNGVVKQRIPCNEPVQCMEYKWGYVFIGTYNGSLRRLNIKKNEIEESVNIANSTVLQLKASTEGARRIILVATRHQAVSVRDAMTGLLLRTMDTTLNPTVYTLLCDMSFVYCGTSKHDVLIYSFQDGQLIHKLEESNGSGVVCLTRYKKLLFTGCYNGNIYAYKLPSNQYVGVIPGPGGLLLSMDILDDKIAVSTRLNFKSIDIPESILAYGS